MTSRVTGAAGDHRSRPAHRRPLHERDLPRTRILVAAASPIAGAQIARLLARIPWVDLVGKARTVPETLALVSATRPQIAAVDASLGGSHDFEKLRRVLLSAACRWIAVAPRHAASDGAAPLRDTRNLPVLTHGLSVEDAAVALKAVIDAPIDAPSIASQVLPIQEPAPMATAGDRFLLIGASTGGVDALIDILSAFPEDCPPTAIVQHTARDRADSLVQLLGKGCRARVVAPRDGMQLQRGTVCIAAGGDQHLRICNRSSLRCHLEKGPPVSGHLPSVDFLFRSATSWADQVVAVLLTGMGRDGAAGLAALRQGGARTIAQDEATSLVYGMPRAAWEMGAVEQQLPLSRIAQEALRATRRDPIR